MYSSWYTFFLLLLAVCESIQKSTPSSLTYKAAVVEFMPVVHIGEPVKTLNENARKSVDFIQQAAIKDADIVVFPELALPTVEFQLRPNTDPWATVIPEPSQNYEPCTNSSIPVSEAVKMIACAAEKNDIYVVTNIVEKEVCLGKANCPSDGVFYFVSNIVFDRRGRIVSRARKVHLYDEFGILDVTETLELSTFETDFGVTFESIVCLDIFYEEPALIQRRALNITDVVFTSAIQMLAGWAYVEDVNLLAGGYNKVQAAYSGTGIFAGRQGILAAVLPMDHHEELLVAEVLKKTNSAASSITQNYYERESSFTRENYTRRVYEEINRSSSSKNFTWMYDDLRAFKSKIVVTNGSVVQTVHHMGIECEFKVNITNLKLPITYHLLAFDGIRPAKSIASGTKVCAVVLCANDTLESCGHIRNSTATFDYIAITAKWVDNGRTLMMPNTLGTDMLPLQNWDFDEFGYEGYRITSISLTTSTRNLVTFGVWGRNFEADVVYSSLKRIV